MRMMDIVAIDFEASGLARDSWPIEIGLAWLDVSTSDPEIQTWSSLIRPEVDWCESLWDPEAEEIHGISLDRLKAEGRSAWGVAEEAWALIEGKTLVSDAPGFDSRWFWKLLDASPQAPAFVIRDFDEIAAALLGKEGLADAWTRLEALEVPHRAGEDASRLMRALVGV